MNRTTIAPAQIYAQRAIAALDAILSDKPTADCSLVVQLLMERPQSLRCALANYLYKLQMQSLNRQ